MAHNIFFLLCDLPLQKHKVPVYKIGKSVGHGINAKIAININHACIESTVRPLMRMWEETSYKLELQQTIKQCADSEFESLATRSTPKYVLTFDPDEEKVLKGLVPVRVAVLREEGTNGDREMAAALARVGFKVWDVTMQDLINGDVTLDQFRGVIFPGGFSYAGNKLEHGEKQAGLKPIFCRCVGIGKRLGWRDTFQRESKTAIRKILRTSRYVQFGCVQWLSTDGSDRLGRKPGERWRKA